MTVRKYYSQVSVLDKRIKALSEAIVRLCGEMIDISASSYSEAKCATSRNTEAIFVQKYERYEWYINELENEQEKMAKLKRQIRRVIAAVPSKDQQVVLRMKYLRGMDFSEIQRRLNISTSAVYDRHAKGIINTVLPINFIEI